MGEANRTRTTAMLPGTSLGEDANIFEDLIEEKPQDEDLNSALAAAEEQGK